VQVCTSSTRKQLRCSIDTKKHPYTTKMDQKERDSSDFEGKEKSVNFLEDEEENELDGLVGE